MSLPKNCFGYPQVNCAALRVAMFFWLLGWFLKICFMFPYLFRTSILYPIADEFFPPFFVNPYVAIVFYSLPMLVVAVVLFNWQKWFFQAAVLMAICAAVLNLHINTCNDATFVTSFWTALWLCWFVRHRFETTDSFKLQAKVLAQSVVAMMFLGGMVGKLTPEYWSGEIFRQIFVEQGANSPIGKILLWVPAGAQNFVLGCLGKIIIGVEFLLALAPLLPYRFIVSVFLAASCGIAMFSTWRIFSVLLCLLGVLLASLLLELKKSPAAEGLRKKRR